MGANISIQDIDTVHRVPQRNNAGNPKPIVCRFVRRLVKESLMSHRNEISDVTPAAVGLPEGSSFSSARITTIFHQECKQSYSRLKNLKKSSTINIAGQRIPLFVYEKTPHRGESSSRAWRTQTNLNVNWPLKVRFYQKCLLCTIKNDFSQSKETVSDRKKRPYSRSYLIITVKS